MTSTSSPRITRVNPMAVAVEHRPLDPETVIDGTPMAGWAMIGVPPGIEVGLWEHPVGESAVLGENEVVVTTVDLDVWTHLRQG